MTLYARRSAVLARTITVGRDDQSRLCRHVVRPLLELHDVFELVFDDVLPATAGAAITASSAIEARRDSFMASSLLSLPRKNTSSVRAFLIKPLTPKLERTGFDATFSSRC
jgi:hypothetical protein